MKQRVPFIAFLALSSALHAAGAIAISRDGVAVEGGSGGHVALVGESFEDLAQGAQPVMAAEAPAVLPATSAAPSFAATPPTPALAASSAPTPNLPVAEAADLNNSVLTEPAPAVMPDAAEPVQPTLAPTAAPAPLAPATDVASAAPESSPRPHARPDKPVRAPKAQARQAIPAGNADHNARKGSQTRQEAATASVAQGARTGAQQAGNAAKSTYPGLVLRQIERTRKPTTAARGTVVVAFRVGPSGALASARVARSSGDPSLERAALDHIRRAAPFPPPPAGSETNFSFEFVGRR